MTIILCSRCPLCSFRNDDQDFKQLVVVVGLLGEPSGRSCGGGSRGSRTPRGPSRGRGRPGQSGGGECRRTPCSGCPLWPPPGQASTKRKMQELETLSADLQCRRGRQWRRGSPAVDWRPWQGSECCWSAPPTGLGRCSTRSVPTWEWRQPRRPSEDRRWDIHHLSRSLEFASAWSKVKGQPGIDQIRNACGACCRTVPCCCSLKHRPALQPMMTREENQRGSGNPKRDVDWTSDYLI